MALLLSFTLGAVAQNVASSATSINALSSGYYVIRAKSNDGKATTSYLYAENNKVFYDALGSEKSLAGSSIDASTSKYMFYVTKNNDGTINISLWNDTNTSWPNISNASLTNQTPGQQDQFTMNSSKGAFTATANGDAYILSLASHYYKVALIAGGNKSCTGYVMLNDNQHVGYYDWQENSYKNDAALAQVQFFAVSGTPVSITYNLQHNGSTLYSETHSPVFAGSNYPDFSTDLNKYYLSAEKPSGTISATDGDKTFNIELAQQKLPFTCEDGAYYYFGTAGDNPVMFSHQSGDNIAYRSKAQAEAYNDIIKDLWTIRGNVFDGFQFTNASSTNTVKSSNCIDGNTVTEAAANLAEISFSGLAANTNTWYIRRGTNGFIIYPNKSNETKRNWQYNGSNVKFNDNATTGNEFAFYAPEFSFPMYTVGDASYNSIALPFAAKLADDETNVKMYKGKVSETVLNITEVGALPASAGVVLVGSANAETAKFVAVKSADEISDNDLVGTTVAIDTKDLSDKLIFGVADDDANAVGFFSANSTATLNANHAYIRKTNAAVSALSIHIGGKPTGITLPVADKAVSTSAPVYDLSGRRVNSTVKGHLYIQNGRKFIAE